MNSSSPDPLRGHDPADLLAAAAMPTGDGADTPPLDRADLPSLEEVAAAFPDLEILELIGHGGMSAVFKARQPKLDRLVALKVLPKSLAATPGFTERFNREGRVLARLSHPHIVVIHDFGASGGFAYLVMEYVDGVNLRQAMRAGRFTPEQALGIVPDICDALQFAHARGVLHRDIKPENLLLDAAGRVKIADFGIAKILDEKGGDAMLLTQSGARLGTAPYMAPEQIEEPASVDHRADIYSLGVVFYEMLTGELPLGRFAAPSEKSEVGHGIDTVVMRALEKERERRQQSAGDLRTEVEDAARSEAEPVSGPPFAKWKAGRHLAVAGVVLTAIAVVIGFVVPLILMPRMLEGVMNFTTAYRGQRDLVPVMMDSWEKNAVFVRSLALAVDVPAILGMIAILTALIGYRYREPWFFWSVIFLMAGLIIGGVASFLLAWVPAIATLIYCIRHRREFTGSLDSTSTSGS